MKESVQLVKETAAKARATLLYEYREQYFNLWLQAWKWPQLTRDQREYIMRRFWIDGGVAAFDIVATSSEFLKGVAPDFIKETLKKDCALLGFAPFAVQNYNMYNYPITCRLINERGVPYIPNIQMQCNKNVVLGYAQHSRQPIATIVEMKIERIVDVEMTIRTNLIAHKLPIIIGVTPNSQRHAENLINSVLRDESAFIVNEKETAGLESIKSDTPYIIDKLYNYKVDLENELNTFLGIDNTGKIEKRERVNEKEVDTNSSLITDFSDSIGDNLKEFCEQVKKVLGYSLTCEPTNSPKEEKEPKKPTPKGEPTND